MKHHKTIGMTVSTALALISMQVAFGRDEHLVSARGARCITDLKIDAKSTSNRDYVDIVPSVHNGCSFVINVRVCREGTRSCTTIKALPYMRSRVSFGTFLASDASDIAMHTDGEEEAM